MPQVHSLIFCNSLFSIFVISEAHRICNFSRPVIAYSFFILYALVKVMQFSADMPWLLWTAEDQAIFAGIISFYFGQRAMAKLRSGK